MANWVKLTELENAPAVGKGWPYETEAGDIVIPIAEGAMTYDHVIDEIGAVLLGSAPGRMSPTDITIFKSVGMAVQDAVTAPIVYRRAIEQGLGQHVTLA